MSALTEQIKERLAIADVVGGYLDLKNAGVNLKARCPFHNEKTPSFTVSPTRNTYYCFGCGAKGDVFTFVQEFEGLDFKGALRVLAERAGVPIVYERRESTEAKDVLFDILEEATRFFEAEIVKHKDAYEYVRGRGVNKETIAHFRIGYAPAQWDGLNSHLREKGYLENDIERSGLIKEGERGFYDRFRGRILFPIADPAGRVVAFSGRIFDEKATGAGEAAKYINSPETPVYSKSKILFGYDKAKLAIRRNNFSILVEGQMDLVLSHQAGFRNSVAVSGTALTHAHVDALSRLSTNVVFALDADDAGARAIERGADAALAKGMDVKIAALPQGRDPAESIKEGGADVWRGVIRESKHVVDFFLDRTVESGYDERKRRLEISRTVLPFIARIQNAIDRAYFVNRVADRLGVPTSAVEDELRKIRRVDDDTVSLVSEDARAHTKSGSVSRRELLARTLLGILAWQEGLGTPSLDVARFRERLKSAGAVEAAGVDDLEGLAFETEALHGGNDNLGAIVEDLERAFKEEALKEAFVEATRMLREAEAARDDAQIKRALERSNKISKQLASLVPQKE